MSKVEEELFHIIHKVIWLINEGRRKKQEIHLLDNEIGYAVQMIRREDIVALRKVLNEDVADAGEWIFMSLCEYAEKGCKECQHLIKIEDYPEQNAIAVSCTKQKCEYMRQPSTGIIEKAKVLSEKEMTFKEVKTLATYKERAYKNLRLLYLHKAVGRYVLKGWLDVWFVMFEHDKTLKEQGLDKK